MTNRVLPWFIPAYRSLGGAPPPGGTVPTCIMTWSSFPGRLAVPPRLMRGVHDMHDVPPPRAVVTG
ncbi:hypothetical protein [Streptosporangium sp. OZ121]|uniref:hypothetical protein n=1 Tax=Streptosporangium sp. OZ121 TaxID=3444183 RepID=UPI003F798B82